MSYSRISVENSNEVIVPSKEFKSMTLEKFSLTKHFEIGFMNSKFHGDDYFLKNMVGLNTTKESISHISFIKKEDVNSFMENAASSYSNLLFPPYLLEELRNFTKYRSMETDDDENEAYSMKFKLIHKMYEQYAAAVKEKRQQDLLNKQLDILAGKKPASRNKKRKSVTNLKLKSSIKTIPSRTKEDYTEVELPRNDIVVDDLLAHQVHFYIFYGYENLNFMKYLLRELNIEISFIIEISKTVSVWNKKPKVFWQTIDEMRTYNSDLFQNVVFMKYHTQPDENGELNLIKCLKEFISVIRSLIDLKRLHFNYIKNLKIVDTEFTETFREYPIYDEIMATYPLETVTIPLIIHGMLQEVQTRNDGTPFSIKSKKGSKEPNMHNSCSFINHKLLSNSKVNRKRRHVSENFKIYKGDLLNLTLKSYECLDYSYVQNNLDILKTQKPFDLIRRSFFEPIDDFNPHTHDLLVPSDEGPVFTDEQVDHLMNLLYLKKFCVKKEDNCGFYGHGNENNEFIKNFIVHDDVKSIRDILPRCLTDDPWNTSNVFLDQYHDSNVYGAAKAMSLHWAEILSPEVLVQYLFDSQLEFSNCDYIMCPITNCLLLRFHHNVNSFGLHTKVWKEHLRTPIGLGDFCRFTLQDDYTWLKSNNIYPQILFTDVMKMIEDNTLVRLYKNDEYKAYRKFLIPQILGSNLDIHKTFDCQCLEENACESQEKCYDMERQTVEELFANLESILNDLMEYKNKTDISEHCKNKNDEEYSFAAYDFGLTKFEILGHTTDFVSLDGVHLTIDTSRFCDENFKMMLKIASEGNLIVLHYPQERFNFHVFLPDETLIVFSKPTAVENEGFSLVEQGSEPTISNILDSDDLIVKKDDDLEKSSVSAMNIAAIYPPIETSIVAMDFEHYSSINQYPIVGNRERISPEQLLKPKIEREIEILKKLREGSDCLKVSNKCRNLRYLKRKIPERNVPLINVVQRIIENPEKDIFGSPRIKCDIKNELKNRKFPAPFNCTITVPNGMSIKFLASEALPESLMVKQSFEFAPPPEETDQESYRMFTEDGYVIIGRTDGTIHLLTASGKEIRFSKISTQNGLKFSKPQKQFDENTFRKVVSRLMSTFPDQKHTDYNVSRRGHFTSKSRKLNNENLPEGLSSIPYSAVSITTFEGEKLTIKDEKITKVRHCRHTSDINHQTEERSFHREDGFKSVIGKDGTQYMEFSDGTVITTRVYIKEEPIRINKNDVMGWVLITSTFLYEHPFYKSVFFDNENSAIEIRLGEKENLKFKKTGCILEMCSSITLDIKTNNIYFEKTCDSCNTNYKCDISIDSWYHDKKPEDESTFVFAEDSFKKRFKTNFMGQCRVGSAYIPGQMNIKNCLFHQNPNNQYNKIFLLKNDKTGMLLWNDNFVSSLIKDSEHDEIVNLHNNTKDSLVFLTIKKNSPHRYNERFFRKILKKEDESETETNSEGNIVYQTTRNIYSMFDIDQIVGLLNCLKKSTPETFGELTQSLTSLKFNLEVSEHSHRSVSRSSEPEKEVAVSSERRSSTLEKIIDIGKKNVQVRTIMRMPIPKYFNFEFCTFEKSINQ